MMSVTAQFHGLLADWIGTPSASFHLFPNAPLADLMAEIGRRFRPKMPDQLWDDENNIFKGKVLAVGPNGIPKSLKDLLTDGEEIKFFIMMAGG